MTDDSTYFQNRYRVLRQQFHTSLPARLAQIVSSGRDWLAAEAPGAANEDFQLLVHNMAGTAGSFGFPEVTTLCQQIEDALREDDADAREAIRTWLDQLQVSINSSFGVQMT